MNTLFKAAALAAFMLVSCTTAPSDDPDAEWASLRRLSFKEMPRGDIPNPERGFLSHIEIFSNGSMSPLSNSVFESSRLLGQRLIYTIYYMPDFIDSPISDSFLALVDANMKKIRENGFKCVLRFAYKRNYTEFDHPWDAAPEVVNGHIDQLAPVLRANSDVIFCLEAGFVGTFGEWYYTDNYVYQPKTAADYELRRQLLKKLLRTMPETRQVLVRYPTAKTTIYGITAADSLTVATAHDGSDISRTGHHNDCFVSSSNDVGTYMNTAERKYVYAESRYTIWGGETCALTPYCDCKLTLPKCEEHHMTYLNLNYHQSVISRWRSQGCFSEISRRMGYRLSLETAMLSKDPMPGENMKIVLKIRNGGYAAPMNPRALEIVIVDSDGTKTVHQVADADPRFWFENTSSVVETDMRLPDSFGKGSRLYLNLPDPEKSLHDNPAYSIRLANEDIWDEETGYNLVCTF